MKFREINIDSNPFKNDESSCGLDFWHSTNGKKWLGSFLNSRAFGFEITDGEKTASLHCLLRQLPGGYYLASAYPYTSIQGNTELIWENKDLVKKHLKKRRIIKLEMPFTGEYADQFFDNHEESQGMSLNAVRHVIDLSPANGDLKWLDKYFGRKIRWAVNKSKRSGCTVREATINELDNIQELYVKTMKSKGAPVNYSAKRFAGIMELLSPKGQGKIFIGSIDGKPAGFAAVVDARTTRHFIQLAVPPESQSLRLSELLVATVIEDALKQGKIYFDFMASKKNDAGLISFKKKWGTKEESIKYSVIVSNPLLSRVITVARWANEQRGKISANKAYP